MGTEQQQELKSEKPLTKQQRKTIPFKDKLNEINQDKFLLWSTEMNKY